LYFSQFLKNQGIPNPYANFEYQHTTENRQDGDNKRSEFKKIFAPLLDNPKYLERVKQHYAKDYKLINEVQFFRG
jgi:hypothetical protein